MRRNIDSWGHEYSKLEESEEDSEDECEEEDIDN